MTDEDQNVEALQVEGAVAVVTGGASGIGRVIVEALLDQGAVVYVADVERGALDRTLVDLAGRGSAVGVALDVTDESATDALAQRIFDEHGRCNFVFLNAGVTSGGGGLPWQQEPNDWRWCFGVNVIGVGIGIAAFVPRMIQSGAPGQVVLTSSKDGGIAPIPTASVYAASKAAVSCLAESLQHNLIHEGTALRASVFYPSGGLMDTGLYTASRNRPEELRRTGEATGRASMTFDQLVDRVAQATGTEPPVADLPELGRFAVAGAARRNFLIAKELGASAELLHRRADAIGAGQLPPPHVIGL
ncbi:MAG: SDR family NAD(P)-dependent oxidoreductase [Actinomycetes bacterium]